MVDRRRHRDVVQQRRALRHAGLCSRIGRGDARSSRGSFRDRLRSRSDRLAGFVLRAELRDRSAPCPRQSASGKLLGLRLPPVAAGVGCDGGSGWRRRSRRSPSNPPGAECRRDVLTSYVVGVAVALARRSEPGVDDRHGALVRIGAGDRRTSCRRSSGWRSGWCSRSSCRRRAVRRRRGSTSATRAPNGRRRAARLGCPTHRTPGFVDRRVRRRRGGGRGGSEHDRRRPARRLRHRASPRSNYGLDDRGSVRWLMDNRKSGDVVMSTHYGLAAIWVVRRRQRRRCGRQRTAVGWHSALRDPSRSPRPASAPAGRRSRIDRLRGRSRLVVYLGFRMNVEPEGSGQLVIEEFGRRWPASSATRNTPTKAALAIFDLRGTPTGPPVIPTRPGQPVAAPVQTLAGCVSASPARRW